MDLKKRRLKHRLNNMLLRQEDLEIKIIEEEIKAKDNIGRINKEIEINAEALKQLKEEIDG